jgi:hypothetical protein
MGRLGVVTSIHRIVIAKVNRLDMTIIRGKGFDLMTFLKEVLPISLSYRAMSK